MGKTAPLNKKTTSIHSRAARREGSPSLNLDSSLKTAKPPTTSFNPLATQNAGIAKKQKKKQLTRNQKLRQQKTFERAEAFSDRIATKKSKSLGTLKKVKERAKDWDQVNGNVGDLSAPQKEENGADGDEDEWMDEDDEKDASTELLKPAKLKLPGLEASKEPREPATQQPENVPLPAEEEEEEL